VQRYLTIDATGGGDFWFVYTTDRGKRITAQASGGTVAAIGLHGDRSMSGDWGVGNASWGDLLTLIKTAKSCCFF